MIDGREEIGNSNALRLEEEMAETLASAPIQVAYRLRWAKKTGSCLTVQFSTVNETGLGAQEWQYALFL